MVMKTKTSTPEFIIEMTSGILATWNEIETGREWVAEVDAFGTGVKIYDKKGRRSAHGSMLQHIAGLSDVFGWCWAAYADDDKSIYIIIS